MPTECEHSLSGCQIGNSNANNSIIMLPLLAVLPCGSLLLLLEEVVVAFVIILGKRQGSLRALQLQMLQHISHACLQMPTCFCGSRKDPYEKTGESELVVMVAFIPL